MSDNNITMVCDEAMLQIHTSNGWKLRQILEEEHVVELKREQEPQTESGRSMPYPYGVSPRYLRTDALAKRHRYLLVKSTASRVGELEEACSKLLHDLDLERRGGVKRLETVQGLENKLADKDGEVSQLKEQLERLRIELRGVREVKGRMEQDLAAIRQDIGEAAMKRILEGVTR